MDGGGAGVVIDWIMPVGTLGAAFIVVGSIPWWLSSKFNEMRKEFALNVRELGDKIQEMINYHERHDDARFNNIQNDLVAIKIRNAVVDAEKEKNRNNSA